MRRHIAQLLRRTDLIGLKHEGAHGVGQALGVLGRSESACISDQLVHMFCQRPRRAFPDAERSEYVDDAHRFRVGAARQTYGQRKCR
jgi:hypothetical protein